MSATSPHDKVDVARYRSSDRDVLTTTLLHVALLLLIGVVFLLGLALAGPTNDKRLWDVAFFLLYGVPLPVLGISIVVSIILLATRRGAFYVPLLAAAVIAVCAAVGLFLAQIV